MKNFHTKKSPRRILSTNKNNFALKNLLILEKINETDEMNTSLSTVDTLFNGNTAQPIQRSSPSFVDSEPPSYFEAIGINHNNVIIGPNGLSNDSANTSRLSSFQTNLRLPKVSLETSQDSIFKPTSNRSNNSHYISNNPNQNINRLPIIISQQNVHQNIEIGTSNQYLKPSETYMVWSIFTTLYCVLIGVPALVLSIKVYHYNKQEQFDKAYSRSRIARYLNIAGLFFGIVYIGIAVLTCFIPRR